MLEEQPAAGFQEGRRGSDDVADAVEAVAARAEGEAGLVSCACHVPGDLLNNGVYRVAISLFGPGTHADYEHGNAITFTIEDDTSQRGNYFGEWPGVIRPTLGWEMAFVHRLPAEHAAAIRSTVPGGGE